MADNESGRRGEPALGLGYAILAYVSWGLLPLYWKAVGAAPAHELLAHRGIWALVFLGLLVTLYGRWGVAREVLRSRPRVGWLLLTTALVAANWGTYVWAVNAGRLMEASFGYYITPLVNVLLGFLILGERLTRGQTAAVALSAVGVIWLGVSLGVPPWVALVLAFSFGFYGLIRKVLGVDALVGLMLECLCFTPFCVAWLVFLSRRNEAVFLQAGLGFFLLLTVTGPVTALPLLWFNLAAARLRYVTIGLVQYLAPTGQFLLAVLAFGEPFTRAHAVAFSCIWLALAIYTLESLREARAQS